MSNAQKTPFSRSINLFAQQKALDEIEKRGGGLPCSILSIDDQIVTVKFEIADVTLQSVSMPIATSRYVSLPVQVGDKGLAMPSSTYLGGISGLGGGVADMTLRGNLSALVWLPVANRDWSVIDPNAVVLQAPNGVILTDDSQQTTAQLTPNSFVVTAHTSITFQVGSHAIVINASGITIDGKPFLPHTHGGVQTGGGVSGPVS